MSAEDERALDLMVKRLNLENNALIAQNERLQAEIRRLNVDAQRVTLPPGTIRAQVKLVVDADGEYRVMSQRCRPIPRLEVNGPDRSHVVFIEADVPLPPAPPTVKGRVTP